MRLKFSNPFPLGLLLLLVSSSVSATRNSRQSKSPLVDWQKRMLEKIQLLAREGGLSKPEWRGITEYAKEVCYEKECLTSALEIMTATNFSVNPCEHEQWLNFVCARRVNGPDNLNDVTRLAKVVDVQTKNILAGKVKSVEKDFLLKEAQTFYHQCKNKAVNDDQDVKDILKYAQDKYGGWPILTNRDPGTDFNWMDMVADLNRIERHNYVPLLLQVQTLGGVTAGHAGLTGISLGIGKTSFSHTDGDLVSMLERVQKSSGLNTPARLMQTKGMVEFVNGASGAGHNQGVLQNITIAELHYKTEQYFDSQGVQTYHLNWLKFFQDVYAESSVKVTSSTPILVVFEQVLGVVQAANQVYGLNRTLDMANSLHFQFVSTLLQESTTLLDDLSSFSCLEQSGSREENCLRATTEIFGWSLGKSYLKAFYNDEKSSPAIADMMTKIQKGFKIMIDETEWMEDTTKNYLKDKVDNMETFYTQPDWTRDPKKLVKFYRGLKASTNSSSSYPLNFINVMNWVVQKKASFNKKHMDYAGSGSYKGLNVYDSEWSHFLGTPNAQFNKMYNQARIEGGLTQSPVFAVGRPGFMNFGGIGTALAHEIGHSYDRVGRTFNKDAEHGEFWDPVSVQKYNEYLQKMLMDYGSNTHQFSDTEKETTDPNIASRNLDEDIADALGIFISYHSYQEYLKELEVDGKKEKVLPGLKSFTPQKLFFMKYGNMWCDKTDVQNRYTQYLFDNHSPGNTRATMPLKRSNEFAATFGCPLIR